MYKQLGPLIFEFRSEAIQCWFILLFSTCFQWKWEQILSLEIEILSRWYIYFKSWEYYLCAFSNCRDWHFCKNWHGMTSKQKSNFIREVRTRLKVNLIRTLMSSITSGCLLSLLNIFIITFESNIDRNDFYFDISDTLIRLFFKLF